MLQDIRLGVILSLLALGGAVWLQAAGEHGWAVVAGFAAIVFALLSFHE